MLSFLIVVLNLIRVLKSQNYCIWGKTGSNSGVNGLYTDDGTYGGQPSYVKTIGAGCASPTLYLWYTGSQWGISDTKGGTSFNMLCSQSDLSSCSTNTWGSGNEAVYAQSNSCPSWDCTSLNTTTTWANCDGPFDTIPGTNNAFQSISNMYWYFVPQMFSWVCNNALEITPCPTQFFAISETGWNDLQPGSNINLDITDTKASPTTNPSTINCLGTKTPTQTPVPAPTTSPNTPNSNPTISPVSPTNNPVAIPAGTPSAVCIWGRTDPSFFNTAINGLYIYDGESNNKASYKKTIDCDTGLIDAYLHYNGQWMISNTKGSASNYANCNEADIASCTAGKWQAVITDGGGFEAENNLYAQLNSCPSWDCASVSSTDSNPNCKSFNTQIDVNTWSDSNGEYIWYFDPTFFIWKCINTNTYPNYDSCTTPASSRTLPNPWVPLSNGQNTVLSYAYPPTTTSATLECSGVSFPSPTHATSTPTQVTPVPTTHPSQSPILPGTPTGSPIKTPTGSPIKTPTNNPIKTPTQSPVLPPGTPTKAPVTPHPTQMGTAKPTTHAPTDDQGTARPTQPTTKQPTSQGATDWDCISISGLDDDNLNGNYNKLSEINNDRSSYELKGDTNYYLYYMYWPAYDKYYWVITQVLGSDSNRIFAYCHEYDIAQCSGITLHNGIVQTDNKFVNCANIVIESTNDGDGNSQSKGGENNESSGLTTMGWIIIIVGILVGCCCCIIIILLCFVLLQKKKKKQRTADQFGNNDDDQYGDTVKMNKDPQYNDPYAQEKIYTDDRL